MLRWNLRSYWRYFQSIKSISLISSLEINIYNMINLKRTKTTKKTISIVTTITNTRKMRGWVRCKVTVFLRVTKSKRRWLPLSVVDSVCSSTRVGHCLDSTETTRRCCVSFRMICCLRTPRLKRRLQTARVTWPSTLACKITRFLLIRRKWITTSRIIRFLLRKPGVFLDSSPTCITGGKSSTKWPRISVRDLWSSINTLGYLLSTRTTTRCPNSLETVSSFRMLLDRSSSTETSYLINRRCSHSITLPSSLYPSMNVRLN